MKIPTLFKEYIWLIETISQAGKISFADLNRKWVRQEASGGVALSRTTFNRHRDAILDMFGVIIECDRRDGYRYYIENREVLRENSVQNWLFSTLSVSNMLDENVALQNRILLESVPSGNQTLHLIIRAMRESRRIMITYRRYGSASMNSFSVAPYCVKLFKKRWYVLAKLDQAMAIFSLDRIESIELQERKFSIEPDFDVASYFNDCFGIVIGDGGDAERIVLRAYGLEPYYLRSLPLHHSQREIARTDDYTDFEVRLKPTADFMAHLMSRGQWIEIISPKWIADELQRWFQEALDRYQKKR